MQIKVYTKHRTLMKTQITERRTHWTVCA